MIIVAASTVINMITLIVGSFTKVSIIPQIDNRAVQAHISNTTFLTDKPFLSKR